MAHQNAGQQNNTEAKPGLIWREEYAVNLELLNQQHRGLFNLINEWYAEVQQDQISPDAVGAKFQAMAAYVSKHLHLEELIMDFLVSREMFSPESRDKHFKAHRAYVSDVLERLAQMVARLESSPPKDYSFIHDEYMEHLKTLAKWWVPHIQNLDQQYSQALQGVSADQTVELYEHCVSELLKAPF